MTAERHFGHVLKRVGSQSKVFNIFWSLFGQLTSCTGILWVCFKNTCRRGPWRRYYFQAPLEKFVYKKLQGKTFTQILKPNKVSTHGTWEINLCYAFKELIFFELLDRQKRDSKQCKRINDRTSNSKTHRSLMVQPIKNPFEVWCKQLRGKCVQDPKGNTVQEEPRVQAQKVIPYPMCNIQWKRSVQVA